jgi:hypothetical protein
MFHICAQEVPYGTLNAPFSARFSLDASPGLHYYTAMDNTPDYTSDLPDSFDPSWEEPTEQQWEDWRDEAYMDEPYCHEDYDYSYDGAVWESAYGPADDGGYPF